MQRDPKLVTDASKETCVDWDREVSRGNLTPLTGLVKDTSDPETLHVQGRAIDDAECRRRIMPANVMQKVAETRRYPGSSSSGGSGKVQAGPPSGGWPRFAPDGSIVRE